MKRIWIKLYLEMLDDAEFNEIPEFIRWRAIALFLVAGENGDDGLLPPVKRLAWRLRLDEAKIAETLSALTQIGVVHETPDGWIVTNFSKRQRSEEYERVKKYIEKKRINTSINTNETLNLNLNSSSDSFNINGEKKENSPPRTPIEAEFIAHFGGFNGKREQERWTILAESIGFPRLQEIATWAERKEIHMVNRGGLMDSLETAAKKWTEKPKQVTAPEPAYRTLN